MYARHTCVNHKGHKKIDLGKLIMICVSVFSFCTYFGYFLLPYLFIRIYANKLVIRKTVYQQMVPIIRSMPSANLLFLWKNNLHFE